MEYHSVVVGLVKEGFIIRHDMHMQGPRNGYVYIHIYLFTMVHMLSSIKWRKEYLQMNTKH